MVEQRATQALERFGLGRQHVLDVLGEEPVTAWSRNASATTPSSSEGETDEADLPVGHLGQLAERVTHSRGATKGSRPSTIRSSANDAHSQSGNVAPVRGPRGQRPPVARGMPEAPPPDCLKYWKNSDAGSSTITSPRPRSEPLYASRLR